MRDFVVLIAFLGLLPLCFSRPFIGFLVWTCFCLMNPHREAFGIATVIPYNNIIFTFLVMACSYQRVPLDFLGHKRNVTLYLWMFWTITAGMIGLVPTYSMEYFFGHVFPIYIYVFFLLILVRTEDRIIAMVWMVVASLGYYGVMLGLVGILQGGKAMGNVYVYGPINTILQDRNHMSLALCMILPLIYYLIQYAQELWVRRALWITLVISVIAILTSYSRGGWISLIFVGFCYNVK